MQNHVYIPNIHEKLVSNVFGFNVFVVRVFICVICVFSFNKLNQIHVWCVVYVQFKSQFISEILFIGSIQYKFNLYSGSNVDDKQMYYVITILN